MKLLKPILFVLGILAAVAGGFYLARMWNGGWHKPKTEEDAAVLLERIQTVAKLVTVEGYFSEIYNYKDYINYDWWIFRKKALLRVKAKVSVGYDLSNLRMDALPDEQTIYIRNIPADPQILSIDHEIDYYDITEGTFNSFSEADYTKLNKSARGFIEQKAKESDLLPRAREQGIEILEVIRFMAENAGWQVRMETADGTLLERDTTLQQ